MLTSDLGFDIVDVFAQAPFAGNQLAVVHGADALDDGQLLALAREFGFAETTFPGAVSDGGYPVRIFTPGGEIPFAGHPTLGTAWVLRDRGLLPSDSATTVQRCGAGEVAVAFTGDEVELTAAARDLAGPLDHDLVARLLREVGLGAGDRAGEAWAAGTGLTWVHVPVTEEALLRAQVPRRPMAEHDGWPELVDPLEGVNLVALAGERPVRVHARVLSPGPPAAEDAATGSAAAGLGLALAAGGLLPDGGAYEISQGLEMGRPARLRGHVEAAAGVPTSARVAGRVHPVARGSVRVPPPA
ncbi:PhzF family phenazine biosynthesis protein [Nocardioides donggukensis]|uniref:PhzF family phenazine biosynthesis protein n=1 Tax=Nocardioides donggukensis TaxID=2774019 RepID=A0A927K5M4_9ACTN|nr:PhzF family phenazine biosynthesis protein [Nocardioides donggukensis]MBD8870258.1 PhzF family phenazine biosynthesis protein [Nocardioides donggukensis]